MSSIQFLDAISNNWFDNYLFLNNISENLGYKKYKNVGEKELSSSQNEEKNSNFITILKIISYTFVILPLIALICKACDRALNSYKIKIEGKKDPSAPSAPMLSPEQLGNAAFKEICKINLHRCTGPEMCAFASLNLECQRKRCIGNAAQIFSERTITAEEVHVFSVKELLKLPSDDYAAIIDLISGDQALEILQSDAPEDRKMLLYFYNVNFAKSYGLRLRRLIAQPIDKEIQELAQRTLAAQVRCSTETIDKLLSNEKYPLLDKERQHTSGSLYAASTAPVSRTRSAWETTNEKFFKQNLQYPITADFLNELNTGLRVAGKNPSLCTGDRPFGFRQLQAEVSVPSLDVCFLPGVQVADEIQNFISWLNNEISACDKHEKNPIVVAALAFQLFISIHPFMDGNGRTGRLLADLILRRYRLLPAAWGSVRNALGLTLFLHQPNRNNSPSLAVQAMVKALDTSYEIMTAA